jgi:hypothetical protein
MFVPRLQACASGAICAVCGLGYREAERAYVLVKDEEQHTSIPEGVMIQAMDNAVMHRRCLVLALGRCPKLLELRREGKLKVIRTWGNLATPTRHKSPSGLAAVLEAEDCELVDEF